MGNIAEEIPVSNFEVIRDRIVEILQDELNDQFSNYSDPLLDNIKVYSERLINFDKTELPAISVDFDRTESLSKEAEQPQNDCYFNIIANTNAKDTALMRGDERAKKNAQKLIRYCRYIIQSPKNYLLRFGFGSTVVKYLFTTAIQNLNVQNQDDGLHSAACMMTLKIGSFEDNGSATSYNSSGTDTKTDFTKTTLNN